MATISLSKPGGVEHSYGVAAVSKTLQTLFYTAKNLDLC